MEGAPLKTRAGAKRAEQLTRRFDVDQKFIRERQPIPAQAPINFTQVSLLSSSIAR
jgi:hypothetical protein